MKAADFTRLAEDLLAFPPGPAMHRTIIGRSYYGAFHAAEGFLSKLGFIIGRLENAHVVTQRYLCNCEQPDATAAGYLLADLHRARLLADYRLSEKTAENREEAEFAIARAQQVEMALAKCADTSVEAVVRAGIDRYIAKTSRPRSS